jgi:hypothetical protein
MWERKSMEIRNMRDDRDIVRVEVAAKDSQQYVYLKVGEPGTNPRHAHLMAAEARALAYALLSYAEQIRN